MDRKMTPFLIKYDLFRPFGSQKIGYPVKISKMKHPTHLYCTSGGVTTGCKPGDNNCFGAAEKENENQYSRSTSDILGNPIETRRECLCQNKNHERVEETYRNGGNEVKICFNYDDYSCAFGVGEPNNSGDWEQCKKKHHKYESEEEKNDCHLSGGWLHTT